MTIESPQNEKLKLVRKLRERKHREREGLFVSEGEDLVEAGLAAGAEPRLLLSAAGSGLAERWGGEEVEPELLVCGTRYWTIDSPLSTLRESQSHLNTDAGRGTRDRGTQ